MQQWSWVDYLELLMPEALEAAAASVTSTSLREGLPLRFLDYMGAIHDDTNVEELPDGLRQLMDDSQKESASSENVGDDLKVSHRFETFQKLREEFREEAKKRIMRVSKEALTMVDAACDQIGKRFSSDRLPPAFTATEMASTSESRAGGKVWLNTLC
jgi:lysine-specific demethylase/histidyl-hydroxylase NO66